MLSRVAEQIYWFGRHVERVENTARLINVNANMILDLPKMGRQIWGSLINISGIADAFHERYMHPDERNVLRYMLIEPDNPVSMIETVKMARENARITREILPIECWEKINGLHLYVKRHADKGIRRDGRHKFLNEIILYCNQITGLLFGGMSHGHAYGFVRIGRNLERADMGTRIIDVGCLNLMRENSDFPDAFDDLLWMNILRSMSAYQMYRQHVKDRVNGEDVVQFLLKDVDFPRSIAHCLAELNSCFAKLPGNDLPMRSITHTQRLIGEAEVAKLLKSGLHDFIDEIQVDLGDIHGLLGHTWFGHEPETINRIAE